MLDAARLLPAYRLMCSARRGIATLQWGRGEEYPRRGAFPSGAAPEEVELVGHVGQVSARELLTPRRKPCGKSTLINFGAPV